MKEKTNKQNKKRIMRTTPQAFITTAVMCFIVWMILTGQASAVFTGGASAQVIIAGAIVSILVSLFTSRFFIHRKKLHMYNPLRLFKLLFYCIIILPWEIIKANVKVALKAISPKLNIRPGFVKIPVDTIKSDYALSMLANSITLTPGTITVDIAEEKGKTYYYIHWIDVDTEDAEKAGEEIKGTLEKWARRIWE